MWTPHPELNWCSCCWFNAQIESKKTDLGTMWLCLHCGFSIDAYNDNTGKGSLGEDLPRHFTDIEWSSWHAEYQKR